ncbi:MAG: hypothetical protein ABI557_01730, partial [Aureliella sp.]
MKRQTNNRRGTMMILVAVSVIILLVGAVFSVDVAYMHMVRAEMRTATDAAARAGSEELARTQSPAAARAAATAVAELNTVAGNGLTLDPGDIQVGSLQLNAGQFTFVPDVSPFTAVRVVGRNTCGKQQGETDNDIFAAWDQALTSIQATLITSASRQLVATA